MNLSLDFLFNVVKWWKYLRKEDVACPSLQEIGSCLYEISCFFPSLAFLQHRGVARTFVCTFWDENQLYLDSTTFFLPSHLFQVNRSALFAMQQIHIKSFCFGYMFISSGLGWMTWHGWAGFGSGVGSLQELWQRPVLPQLAPAEIEYHWSFENAQWRKGKQLR